MGDIGPDVVLDKPAFVHETALIYGRVHVGPGASIWPYAVIRCELHEVRIGARTNVQDFAMIHIGFDHPTLIGEDCSIAHHATLHGCTIGERCLIGINATVMDGATIGANSVVAGHSIVGEGATFPENSVIAGVPGKLIKTLDCSEANLANAEFYCRIALDYARGVYRMAKSGS
jgi:carbonic anhydrase/acetyltransferase-like protein (isoleucine patch superfamily)